MCRREASLLGPEMAVTGAGALLSLDILKEGESTVLDTEDPDEVGAEIGNHGELGGWVQNDLMGEGSHLADGVDGFVCEGKRGCVLDCARAADTPSVDAVATTAGEETRQYTNTTTNNLI